MKKDEKIEELNDEMSRSQDELNDEPTVPNDANDENEANDETEVDETEALKARIEELEDKNLRMMAEFDNYRRRTNKEKLELMETAGERIFKEMLPLVDDFERALASINDANDANDANGALLNGVQLIYQKFIGFLEKNDVHAIETEGVDFNTDEHEAVTTFAAGEDQKGKVIDCTQKGYKLGDKVIRFAKVVVGE